MKMKYKCVGGMYEPYLREQDLTIEGNDKVDGIPIIATIEISPDEFEKIERAIKADLNIGLADIPSSTSGKVKCSFLLKSHHLKMKDGNV